MSDGILSLDGRKHRSMNTGGLQSNDLWVFNCPYHGLEIQCLCWRAFQQENMRLWQHASLTLRDLTSEEIRERERWVRENWT
jgi:hypothetical protein